MHIESLEIKGFGKINNLKVELVNGFNLVFGPNESGKSTIQAFIKAMFYGLKGGRTSKTGALAPVKKYEPWLGEYYGGSLRYCLSNGDIFTIHRDFEKDNVSVYDRDYNEITSNFYVDSRKNILIGQQHFGLNEECFERTIFIRQMGTSLLEGSNKELASRLISVQESSFQEASFKKAEEALRTALREYVGTEKTSTRPLDILTERLNELRNRRAELSEDLEIYLDNIRDLQEEQKKLLQLKADLELFSGIEKVLNLLGEISVLENKRLTLANLRDEYESAAEQLNQVKAEKQRISEEIEKLMYYRNLTEKDIDTLSANCREIKRCEEEEKTLNYRLRECTDRLSALKEAISPVTSSGEPAGELDRIIGGYEEEAAKLVKAQEDAQNRLAALERINVRDKTDSIRKKSKISTFLSVIFIVLAAVLFAVFPESGVKVISGMLLLASVAAGMSAVKFAREYSSVQAEARENELAVSTIKGEMENINARLRELYGKFDVDNHIALIKVLTRYESLIKEYDSLNVEIDGLEDRIETCTSTLGQLKGENIEIIRSAGLDSQYGESGDNLPVETLREKVLLLKESNSNLEKLVLQEAAITDRMKAIMERCADLTGEPSDGLSISREIEKMNRNIEEKKEEASQLFINIEKEFGNGITYEYVGVIDWENVGTNWYEKAKVIKDLAERTKEEISNTELTVRELETKAKAYDTEDELQRVEEEIEALKAEEARLLKMRTALNIALDVLRESAEEIRENFSPALNMKMSRIIKDITLCRYEDLRVDDSLTLKAKVPETGDIVSAPNLSGGTVDQMYLAMRIASAQLIEKDGEKLPLFLDEVFTQYDNRRLEEVYRFLCNLSAERQIVLFTCRSEELALVRTLSGDVNIIEL